MKIFGLRIERKAAAPNPLYRSLIALIYGQGVVWPEKDYASLARVGYQSLEVVYACVSRAAVAASGIPWGAHTVTQAEREARAGRPA